MQMHGFLLFLFSNFLKILELRQLNSLKYFLFKNFYTDKYIFLPEVSASIAAGSPWEIA